MLLAHETDTIAAIATPVGEGGIAVIRISGDKSIEIASRGFRGVSPIDKMSSHTAHYGRFVDEQEVAIDNAVVTIFKKPHSYTGEDTVEISCHGGRFLAKTVLETLIRFGARAAMAGEFTKRAFLNGRMDLAQAEAVADLIHARSARAHRASLAQLNGQLSERINAVRTTLVESVGLLELELDFAEDGYEFADKSRVTDQIRAAAEEIGKLIATYRVGRIYRDGVKVALAGAPNVGKSSLLNALLQEDRAIVTDIPGTTRDIIEESITIEGLLFDLSDTAGIRDTDDPIEQEGVRRAEERLSSCDILILLLDQSRELGDGESLAIHRLVAGVESRGASCIFALNKTDVPAKHAGTLSRIDNLIAKHQLQAISAKTHQGLDGLKSRMVRAALRGSATQDDSGVIITNARHMSALQRTKQALGLAVESLEKRRSSEFIAVDLREGLDTLGEIVGVTSTEDILNSIFSRFCIGK